MEFLDLLSRISLPLRPKISDEEALKIEEANFSDVIINVYYNIL